MTALGGARRLASALLIFAAALAAAPAEAAEPTTPAEETPTVWVPERPSSLPLTKRLQQRAQRAYAEASKAYQRRRYDAALQHADAAFRTVPNASTALIRATVLAALERDADAFDAYLLALDLDPTPEEAALASGGLERHGAAIGRGWAIIAPTPDDAVLRVAGASWQGRRVVALLPGDYLVVVSAPNHADSKLALKVAAGAGTRTPVELGPAPTLDPILDGPDGPAVTGFEDPALVPEEEESRFPTGLALALGGGALMLTGGGVHLAAASAASDADSAARAALPGDDRARRARYDDAVSRKESLETTAWVLYAVGTGVFITGLVLALDDDGEPAAHVVPLISADGAGASLHVGF